MRVQVEFFAILRELTGIKAEAKEIAENTTVAQLWRAYAALNPRAENIRVVYAVNRKLVNAEYVLREGDRVGFLPPVSGGVTASSRREKYKVETILSFPRFEV